MEFVKQSTIFAYLSLLLIASCAASLTPEAYWNVALPNTPMPKALKDLVKLEGLKKGKVKPLFCGWSYRYNNEAPIDKVRYYAGVDEFFFEGNLRKGRSLSLRLTGSNESSAPFLPREQVEKVPFESKRIADILNHYSLKSNSSEAIIVKEIIQYCEKPSLPIEERVCATSLETMIDHSMSKLGKNIYALSTEVEKETRFQRFKIAQVSKISGHKAVSCHKFDYQVHPVFFCHNTGSVRLYKVSMVGVGDGTRVTGVAVCHIDTSYWNPKHLAFQLLKVQPGTVPVCHVLSEGPVIWVPK